LTAFIVQKQAKTFNKCLYDLVHNYNFAVVVGV